MQQFDITVPVTGSFVVHGPGRYIKYMSGSNGGNDASLFLIPGAQGGNKVRLQPGFAYRVADDQPMPDSWTLQNAAGSATIIGQVVVGNGRIDDSTVQGVVQMVDGGKVRSLANSSFGGYTVSGAIAAQYSRMQLWNPAGSGVRLCVEQITGYVQATSAIFLQDSTAALASSNELGQPKLLGGTQSQASVRYDSTAAVPGNPMIFGMPLQGAMQQTLRLSEPIIIPPGHGLLMVDNTVNTQIAATFEWYEEANI